METSPSSAGCASKRLRAADAIGNYENRSRRKPELTHCAASPSARSPFSRLACAALIVLLAPAAFAQSSSPAEGDWPVYGHDSGGTKYSPLSGINKDNVK